MAYTDVPEDLTRVKNKVLFNLTKRQIICVSIAALTGIPFYFLTRDFLGITNAATGMIILMIPAFMFGMYEKDGLPLEKVLMNMLMVLFIRPHIRTYETENIYEKKEIIGEDNKPSVKKRFISSKTGKSNGGPKSVV
jgi:hypothetical protein